jgi:hypothetical protein
MSSIDLTALKTTLGDYCRSHKEVLLRGILIDAISLSNMTLQAGIKDEQPLLDFVPGDIVKPYKSDFEPNADVLNFKPRVLKVRKCKVDLRLDPFSYEATYLGHFMSAGTDPRNLPFEGFLMQKIRDKVKDQLEMKAIFNGVYNGAGTGPGDLFDGLNKIVSDEITATNIATTVIGALDSATIVAQLETLFYEGVKEEWQSQPWTMFVSPKVKQWYNQNYRADFGQNTNNAQFDRQMIDGTNCKLVAVPGLSGSDRIHLSPTWNFFWGTDLQSDMSTIDIEKDHRYLDVMINFKLGVQIGNLDYYVTNDVI